MGPPMSWALFFPLDHRGYEIGPNFVRFFLFYIDFWSFLFVILFLFFSPFLISSHSSILILVFLSVLILLILLVLFFVFLFFFLILNLFVVLHTHTHTNYVPVRAYVLTFVFWTFIFVILFLFFSLQKTPRKIQFGKKSAKVNHCLYSSTEQLQVALWTFMFLKLGLNNEKYIHTLPLRSVPFLSLPL